MSPDYTALCLAGLCLAGLLLFVAQFRVVREYQRLVVFRIGRFVGARGPGLVMVLPLFDRGVRVDLRETTMPLRGVRLASQDGTTVKADLAVSYRITEAAKSVLAASDPVRSLEARAVAGLRSLVEGSSYADLLIRQAAER